MSVCNHCHKRRISRPRGLCWGCYYIPHVRERHEKALYHPLEDRDCRERSAPHEATDARPGTEAKIKVLARRVARNLALWHPDDAGL